MRAYLKTTLGAAVAALSLAGAAGAAEPAGQTVSAERATAIAETALKGNLDLSTVRVLRMSAGEEALEVVSLRPTLYHMDGRKPDAAGTIIAFTADKKGVVFLTRETSGGAARLHEVRWQAVAEGDTFTFPLRTADGETETREIRIRAKVQRPESDG